MANLTAISGRAPEMSPPSLVTLHPGVERARSDRREAFPVIHREDGSPRAAQQRVVRNIGRGFDGRAVTVDTLLNKAGMENAMGRASRYACVKDKVLRFVHRHVSPFS